MAVQAMRVRTIILAAILALFASAAYAGGCADVIANLGGPPGSSDLFANLDCARENPGLARQLDDANHRIWQDQEYRERKAIEDEMLDYGEGYNDGRYSRRGRY